eukprot:gene2766-3463_t
MTTYIIKSILCSGILLLIYHFFLEKEKMHRFNRFYLVGSIMFSLIVPLITLQLESEQVSTIAPVYKPVQRFVTAIPNMPDQAFEEQQINWVSYAPAGIYILVTFLLLIRLIRNLIQISRKRFNRQIIPYRGAKLVLLRQIIPYRG